MDPTLALKTFLMDGTGSEKLSSCMLFFNLFIYLLSEEIQDKIYLYTFTQYRVHKS